MTLHLGLWEAPEQWRRVTKFDPIGCELADRHYSRQTVGAGQFMPPGRTLVLISGDDRAVWGVALNLDPTGALRWRCTIFRNEGPVLSSELVRSATGATFAWWLHHYHALPAVRLTTEIDPEKVRAKRDPGRCFLRAGWSSLGVRQRAKRKERHVLLTAPGETERVP